jgi:hypothetical protein
LLSGVIGCLLGFFAKKIMKSPYLMIIFSPILSGVVLSLICFLYFIIESHYLHTIFTNYFGRNFIMVASLILPTIFAFGAIPSMLGCLITLLRSKPKILVTRRFKTNLTIVIILFAVTWVFGHFAVRESIDVAEERYGDLKVQSFPLLPCVMMCSSGNMKAHGGRSAIGIYIWYGFGVKKVVEVIVLVA